MNTCKRTNPTHRRKHMSSNQNKKQLQALLATPAANNVQLFDLVGKAGTDIQRAIDAALKKSGRITVCIISN
jgi:hypothetical protein